MLSSMSNATSNIEFIARYMCSVQLAKTGLSGTALAADVDRYWHCVAVELESGQIDDTSNRLTSFDLEEGLKAYNDWCRRHPRSQAL